MMKKTKSLLAAIIATMGVASCSSGGSDGTSNSPADSAGGGGSGAAPIKLGAICSCSGPYATVAQNQVKLFKLGVDSVNAKGGVNGHKLEVMVVNDGANPGTSISQVKKLVDAGVDSITSFSDVDAGWASTIGKTGIPVIGSLLSLPSHYTYPSHYPEGTTADVVMTAAISAAKQNGAKDLGIIYCKESPACTALQQAGTSAAKKAGLSLSYNAQVASAAPNYTAQCLAAKDAKSSAILFLMDSNTVRTIAKDCSSQDFHPLYVQLGDGVNFDIAKSSTGLKDNFVAAFTTQPSISTLPAVQAMMAAVEKKYPGLPKTDGWTESDPAAYYTALLIAKAADAGGLTATGKPSKELLIKGLESFKGETLGNLVPPLTYAPGKPHSIKCWFVAKVVDGKASVENGGKPTCGG